MTYYIDGRQVSEEEWHLIQDRYDVGWEEGLLPDGSPYQRIYWEEVIK